MPAAWVTGDSIYGGDRRVRIWLEQQQQPFVLAVASNEPLWAVLDERFGQPRADLIAAALPAPAWRRLSAGPGAQGPRVFDWARAPLARLQLSAEERRWERWEHWLLVRRSVSAPDEFAYYVVFAPRGTSLPHLVQVAGQRWRSEQSVALAKGEVGLDHYEVRRWDGWYRHMTLAMFALAYLAVLRAQAQGHADGAKGGALDLNSDLKVDLLPLTVPEIRRLLAALDPAAAPWLPPRFRWSAWRRRHQADTKPPPGAATIVDASHVPNRNCNIK